MTDSQRKNLKRYYLGGDLNCAEAVLHAANDDWKLGLSEKEMRLIGGFGGGMGCGSICGAVTGGVAALSAKYNKTKAHETPVLRKKSSAFIGRVRRTMETDACATLKARHMNPEEKCFVVVERIYDLLLLGEEEA